MCKNYLDALKHLQKDKKDLKIAKKNLDQQIEAAKLMGCWEIDGEFRQIADNATVTIREATYDLNIKIDRILQIAN